MGGYDGKSTQLIDTIYETTMEVQDTPIENTNLVVLNMKHDLILGRQWLAQHDVMLDVKNHRLLFPKTTSSPPENSPELRCLEAEDRRGELLFSAIEEVPEDGDFSSEATGD